MPHQFPPKRKPQKFIMKLEKNEEREMEMLLSEIHDVNKLTNGLQSLHISNEPINPFLLQALPTDPFDDMGLCPSSKVNVGFDPYWDSNALNLPPVGSNLKKRRQLANKSGILYSTLYDNLRGDGDVISLLARDQQGCRFLQGKFDKGKQHVDLIFDGVVDCVGDLMMDPFGNYLMQKLFDVCSEEQRDMILLALTEDPDEIFRISMDSHGSRSMQKLIETLKTHQQIALAMSALEPGLLDLIKDVHGNHVIQHCLTRLRTEDTKFIFDAATTNYLDIATYRHGCCVLQRCIGCSTGENRANLIAKISSSALILAQDAFGNYVIQYIIGLKSPSANANLASQFEGNYAQLSKQKFSSNVVEKCFKEFGEDLKAKIVFEMLSESQFEQLVQHPFANYVIKSALSSTKGAPYAALVGAIRPQAALLRTSPYCKRIFSLLSKKSCAFKDVR